MYTLLLWMRRISHQNEAIVAHYKYIIDTYRLTLSTLCLTYEEGQLSLKENELRYARK